MKNLELLPLSDIELQRVKKFAQMHQRYGGIKIDVIAYDGGTRQALIRIIDKKGELSPDDLYKKAMEVFQGEVPDFLTLYFTTMREEDSKYYLTWDHQFVIRVHKYFWVWKVLTGPGSMIGVESTIPVIQLKEVTNWETATEQARKWLKNYRVTHKVEL